MIAAALTFRFMSLCVPFRACTPDAHMCHITEVIWLFAALVTLSLRLSHRRANPGCSKQKQNKNRTRLCEGEMEPRTARVSKRALQACGLRDDEGTEALRKEVHTKQGIFGHIQG